MLEDYATITIFNCSIIKPKPNQMKDFKFIVILFNLIMGLSFTLFAQDSISGQIYDSVSKEPIQFANVGILNSGIGTISNENGEFVIIFNENITIDDTLRISIIGYKKLDIIFSSESVQNTEYYLEPMIYELNEVVVKPKMTKRFGNNSNSKTMRVYFSKANSLGAELGSRIKINRKPCHLKEFSFNIINNDFDSLTFRLNIYSISKSVPDKNLLNSEIVFKIYQPKGLFTLNLDNYSIILNEDVILSVELLELYGSEDSRFEIPATIGGLSCFRLASQDKWKKLNMVKLGYYVIADCG